MADAVIKKFPTVKVKVKAALDRAVTSTKMTAKAAANELKTWGLGEWSSIATITGVSLWVVDKMRGKKTTKAP